MSLEQMHPCRRPQRHGEVTLEPLIKGGLVSCHHFCVATATNRLLVFASIFNFFFFPFFSHMSDRLYLLEEVRDERK